MDESLDKILRTVERISFTVIGFAVAVYLISTAAYISPSGYGKTLLEGISVYLVVGGIILLIWVVYNSINYGHTERAGKPGREK